VATAAEALPRQGFDGLVRDLFQSSQQVVGQEKSRRRLAVALAQQHQVAEGKLPRTRGVLIAGRSGTGKTMMARVMCEACGLPFSEANATQFTEAGYIGRDLTTMLLPLIEQASQLYDDQARRQPLRMESSGDQRSTLGRPQEELEPILEIAQSGVILLDEFDKWMLTGKTDQQGRAKGRSLQAELLKMLEGSTEWVVESDDEEAPGLWFDTTRVLIICCGAFVGLSELVQRRLRREEVSFNDQGFWDLVEPADFVSFGVIPELAGRLSQHIMLKALNPDEIGRILRGPGSVLEEYRRMFSEAGAELVLTDGDVLRLAGRAAVLETGARSIEFVVASVFNEALYQVAELGGGRVTLDASANRAIVR
jgi:ATP-dependent Clp protease ATP-binding subunit ClpX